MQTFITVQMNLKIMAYFLAETIFCLQLPIVIDFQQKFSLQDNVTRVGNK